MLLLSPSPAIAQDDDQAEVRLEVTRLGIGNLASEGSWAAIRVELEDRGIASQREIVLRVRLTDPDGDEAEYDRVVTSNSGMTQAFWLYARLPLIASGIDWIDILVYEAQESADPRFGFNAGKLIGRTQAPTPRVMPGPRGLMAIIGPNSFGLTGYGPTGSFESFLPLAHEVTYAASGLDVSDLPDRWQGLIAFDVLVWGATRDRNDPGRLSPDKARAIREWVEGGGHLVVVLPSIGQEWFSETGNPLAGLLPNIKPPRRLEGVNLNTYRPLLTSAKADEVPLPTNAMVRIFEPASDARPGEAIPILSNAEGQCVGIRRLYGGGAVTLIGLDLNQTMLRNLGLPEPGTFWHRVLGRRGQLVSAEQIRTQKLAGNMMGLQQRSHIQLDVDIPEQIAMKGTAAFGVGLGVLVFVLFWLAAGPAGYYLLGRRNLRRFSWLAFVATVAVFTGISWVGATAARPHKAIVRHMTLLQSIHGQPTQRARSWQAMLIPYYGDAKVTIQPESDADPGRELLSIFESSGSVLSLQGFPDNRPYRIEARSPNELIFPARSTVKELEIDWVGPARWQMPEPVTEPGSLDTPVLRLAQEGEFAADGTPLNCDAVGELVHSLPGPLEDVVVLVNKGQVTLSEGGKLRGNLFANVSAYELTDPWLPEVRLTLEAVTKHDPAQGIGRQLAFKYLTGLLRGERVSAGQTSRPNPARLGDRLKALALFPMLEPPSMVDAVGVESRLAKRELTHGYDLGIWFTQPSIMIIGQVRLAGDNARSPIPVALDGKVVPAEGTTLVMWVYPLEANPPKLRLIEDEVNEDETDSNKPDR
jgi:hypothetical protein